MNDQPITAEEQDDAAFRARLAPLASEILPRPPAIAPSPQHARDGRRSAVVLARAGQAPAASPVAAPPGPAEPPRVSPRARRRMVFMAAALTGAVVVLGVASLLFRYPSPEPHVPGRTLSAAATAEPGQRPASVAASTVPAGSPTAPEAAPAAPLDQPPPPLVAPADNASAAMIGLLVQRGDASLVEGDIVAARLLFERAAAMGSAAAATAVGATYDIDFLLRAGARGVRADPAAAAAWYRKAAALGDPEARARLARIEGGGRP
jgi:TPR repeat protein